MRLAIASDHAGFELKETLKKYLQQTHELVDFGTTKCEPTDYPIVSIKAAQSVAQKECDLGVIICGTGIGSCIAANKVKGVRAALCHSTDFALMSRKHNNANIIVLPGRFIAGHYAIEILKKWLETAFEGGRHQKRIDLITEYERQQS